MVCSVASVQARCSSLEDDDANMRCSESATIAAKLVLLLRYPQQQRSGKKFMVVVVVVVVVVVEQCRLEFCRVTRKQAFVAAACYAKTSQQTNKQTNKQTNSAPCFNDHQSLSGHDFATAKKG